MPKTFMEISWSSFYVILLTDTKNHRHWWKYYLLGRGKCTDAFTSQSCLFSVAEHIQLSTGCAAFPQRTHCILIMLFKCLWKFTTCLCIITSSDHTERQKKSKKKTNLGFQSHVLSLFHNLDYKKENARGFLAIYNLLCAKKARNLLLFSSLSGWNTLGW